MIFVDTGAWFALSIESDPDHAAAEEFIAENRQPLVTSDFVVAELLNLFVFRRERAKGIRWVNTVLNSGGIELISIDSQLFSEACQVYSQFADKMWSFTDCTSYVVMKDHSIAKAFRSINIFSNLAP